MSHAAACLLFWSEQSRTSADADDAAYCSRCARVWAICILAGEDDYCGRFPELMGEEL